MAPSKKVTFCPLCHNVYAALSHHLKRGHYINNLEERKILLGLSRERINYRNVKCPVLGCSYSKSRLDKHIVQGHPELSEDELKSHLKSLRYQVAVKLLSDLRATDPVIPLQTTFDLELEDEDEHLVREEEEEACTSQRCRKRLQENITLKAKLGNVELALSKALLLAKIKKPVAAKAKARPLEEPEVHEEQVESEVHEEPEVHEEQDEQVPEPQKKMPRDVKSARAQTFRGSGRGFGMRDLPFPKSIVAYMDEYKKFLEGSAPSAKRKDNAMSKCSRVKSFLYFLSSGTTDVSTWKFLDNIPGIRSYSTSLLAEGKLITTANFYLRNIASFCLYFEQTPPRHCRLSKSQIIGIKRQINSTLTGLSKDVLLHQIKVKANKMRDLISRESLRKCQMLAKEKIPKLLDQMEKDNAQTVRYTFYGYFSALVCSIYGHRPGVLTNMTVEEVKRAKIFGDETEGDGYLICVDDHKTTKDFGAAQLFLTDDEFKWLERWLELRALLKPKNNRVFVTAGHGPIKNLVRYMQTAWVEMDLPGRPTFTDLRTAVSGHAKNHHAPRVRDELAKLMCHSTETADRFYALNLQKGQVKRLRELFEEVVAKPTEEAIVGSSGLKRTKKTLRAKESTRESTEDDTDTETEVQFQESGASSSDDESVDLHEDGEMNALVKMKSSREYSRSNSK